VHAFCPGDHVFLGGVKVPFRQGLAAHSDGDVVLHALCDALLGAAALGDIGQRFPPSDPQWANADSREFLASVFTLLQNHGWRVVNADITIVCEQPRVMPYAGRMRANIAADLDVKVENVSIKATTTEGLGFFGRGEGIGALAVALIEAL
jgi:2-C-methyl-D-erythritol 2,4-cyclodiphosphate synthase